jgi:RimJ/RimL family protein N-acetyltransferase
LNDKIYLRPLQEADAMTSWKWRNNPEVWKLTGNRPDRIITPEIEKAWIQDVLNDKRCKRFAICIENTDEYIGNVQLTTITGEEAEFHIFIGKKNYWGKGLGTQATNELIKYARAQMKLKTIYLFVKPDNLAAIKIYKKAGFVHMDKNKMVLEL